MPQMGMSRFYPPQYVSEGGSGPAPERFHWDLNGTDEFLGSTAASLSIPTAFTTAVSILPRTLDSNFRLIMGTRGPASDAEGTVKVYWRGSSSSLHFFAAGSAGTWKFLGWTGVLAEDVPAHVVFTLDGAAAGDPLKLYINGADAGAPDVVGTDGTTAWGTPGNLIFHVGKDPTTSSWDGKIQDPAILSGALTAGEVGLLYGQAGSSPYAGFTELYHFNPENAADMGLNYGAGAVIDVMDGHSNISAGEDRIQGNLVP